MCFLICFAASNRLCKLLGLGNLGLESRNPVITLGEVGSLEGVLVAVNSSEELDISIICWLRSIGLKKIYC